MKTWDVLSQESLLRGDPPRKFTESCLNDRQQYSPLPSGTMSHTDGGRSSGSLGGGGRFQSLVQWVAASSATNIRTTFVPSPHPSSAIETASRAT